MIEIRVGKLAEKLGVHRNTVGNWIRSGKLRARPTVARRYVIEEEELIRFCSRFGLPESIVDALEIQPIGTVQGGKGDSSGTENPDSPQYQKEETMTDTPMSSKPIGSVMVVGGGIAGIQATLDLADAGYRVYLVEKSAGIGGAMAQLDKTFPTNDCAM